MNIQHLICEIQKRRPLWDKNDRNYHNRDMTQELWIEVASEVRASMDTIRKKWKGLRDVYRKELRKTLKMRFAGASKREAKSKWASFEDMDFLRDFMANGMKFGNLDALETDSSPANVSDYSIKDIQATESQNVLVGPDAQIVPTEKFVIIKSSMLGDGGVASRAAAAADACGASLKRKRRLLAKQPGSDHGDPSDIEKETLSLLRRTFEFKDDDDYNFLLSFMPYLKKMPDGKKLYFRMKMQELLYNIMQDIEVDSAVHLTVMNNADGEQQELMSSRELPT